MGSGILGTNILKGHGFFGFDPTPNYSAVNTARNMAAGNLTVAPDNNYVPPNKSGNGNADNTQQGQHDETPANPSADYSSGSDSSSSYNPADLAYLDSQEGTLRSMLGRSQNTLNQGLTNLSDSYNGQVSSANQRRSRALEDFGVKRSDTINAKEDALEQVDTNARTLNDSLRRILGMASGSDSSAYKYAAPNAVARDASGKRNSVLSDYAENDRNISLAEKRATEDFALLLEDLAKQRNQKESELRSGVLESEQDINRNLADLAAKRAALLGGDYASSMAAQQPYTDAIGSRQAQIDSLFERFRTPTLTPKEVTVQTPTLRDYLVQSSGINANASAAAQDPNQTYSYYRKKQQDQQEA